MSIRIREKPKGSGVWYVFACRNYRQWSRRIGDRKLAEAVAKKLEAKTVLGDWSFMDAKTAPRELTVAQYAAIYAEETVALRMKQSTARSYDAIIRTHILPEFGSTPIQEVTRSDIKTFLIRKFSGGLSRARTERIRAVLSSILTAALDDGHIPANPCVRLGRLFDSKDRGPDIPDPYTGGELRAFLDACLTHEREHYPLFLLLSSTGLRIGEAVGLRWQDVDLDNKTISVTGAIVEGARTTTKTGRTRTIGMPDTLAAVLKDHRALMVNRAIENGWGRPELVFLSRAGTPITPGNIGRRVKPRICLAAGLREIRLHDFRHTFATLALQNGAEVEGVSKSLGHASIKITVDTYYSYVAANDTRIADIMGGIIDGAEEEAAQ